MKRTWVAGFVRPGAEMASWDLVFPQCLPGDSQDFQSGDCLEENRTQAKTGVKIMRRNISL